MPVPLQGRDIPVVRELSGPFSNPVVKFTPRLDDARRYLTDAPTPERMANILRSVDDGDIAALVEITEEMIAKDAHLMGVSTTRRGAITALDWEIEPNPEDENTELAEAKAEYVTGIFQGISNFPDILEHNATAIGPNVAVTELLWKRAELVGLVPVPGHRLTGDPGGQLPGVFVETETSQGVATFSHKWMVYHPHPNGGFPFRSTLTHATVFPWLMTHFSRSDWMAFSELYGVPWRVVSCPDGMDPKSRTEVADMVDQMGSDTAASLPNGCELNVVQASGTGETFQNQTQWAESKMSIAWLGQTLTTENQNVGSFALGKVHDNVRADLLAMDLKGERRAMESQLIDPMIRFRFPNAPGPLPIWKRVLSESRDFDAERIAVEKLQAARAMNIAVKIDQVYEILDLERPADDESDVLGQVIREEPPIAPPDGGIQR